MATPLIFIKFFFFLIIAFNASQIYTLFNSSSLQPSIFLHVGMMLIFLELILRLKTSKKEPNRANREVTSTSRLPDKAPTRFSKLQSTLPTQHSYPFTLLGLTMLAASSILTQIP